MRLLIADDHELIRRGLRTLLGAQPGWQIVAEACNGDEAVSKARLTRPDVAVLDLYMPLRTGLEAAAEIRREAPETVVIVLTMEASALLRGQAKDAGVSAYLLKTGADEALVNAIVAATPKVAAGRVRRGRKTSAPSLRQLLTSREWEIMQLLASGRTSREISLLLEISIRTVESHRTNINAKCGFRTVADLVRFALSFKAQASAM